MLRLEAIQYWQRAAKTSARSSRKIDKYDFLTDEEILPRCRKRVIKQAKFTYSPLGKTFEKEIKIIENQGKNK